MFSDKFHFYLIPQLWYEINIIQAYFLLTFVQHPRTTGFFSPPRLTVKPDHVAYLGPISKLNHIFLKKNRNALKAKIYCIVEHTFIELLIEWHTGWLGVYKVCAILTKLNHGTSNFSVLVACEIKSRCSQLPADMTYERVIQGHVLRLPTTFHVHVKGSTLQSDLQNETKRHRHKGDIVDKESSNG